MFIDAALVKRRLLGRIDAGLALRAVLDRAPMLVLITLSALVSLVPLSVGTSIKTTFGAIALATAGGTIAATLGVLLVVPAILLPMR